VTIEITGKRAGKKQIPSWIEKQSMALGRYFGMMFLAKTKGIDTLFVVEWEFYGRRYG
jgi:hypothetical protein